MNRAEAGAGTAAVAAPVFDHRLRPIVAISIPGNAQRLDLERLAPAVRTAALSPSREPCRDSTRNRVVFTDRATGPEVPGPR